MKDPLEEFIVNAPRETVERMLALIQKLCGAAADYQRVSVEMAVADNPLRELVLKLTIRHVELQRDNSATLRKLEALEERVAAATAILTGYRSLV